MNKGVSNQSWAGFSVASLFVFIAGATVSHLVLPMNLVVNSPNPLIIAMAFFINYGVPLIGIFFVVSLPFTCVVAFATKRPWRKPILSIFFKALSLTVFLTVLLLYGGWYGRNH